MNGAFLAILGPIGLPEMLVILIVGLLVFGSRLPEVGRSLGRGLMEFKRGLRGFQDEMDGLEREADRRIDEEASRQRNEPMPALAPPAADDGTSASDPHDPGTDAHYPDAADLDSARPFEGGVDEAGHAAASAPPADQATGADAPEPKRDAPGSGH